MYIYIKQGLPWWLKWLSICLQCGRPRFNLWVGKISWRRKWQPTPGLLPGKSHGRSNLVGYSPWGHKESDMTGQLSTSFTHCFNLVVSESSHASLGSLPLDIWTFSFSCTLSHSCFLPCVSVSQGGGIPHAFGGPRLSAFVHLFMIGTYQPWVTMQGNFAWLFSWIPWYHRFWIFLLDCFLEEHLPVSCLA